MKANVLGKNSSNGGADEAGTYMRAPKTNGHMSFGPEHQLAAI